MAKKKVKKAKKQPTWDEIGEAIGKKIENGDWESKCKKKKEWHNHSCGSAFYFVGFIGAVAYYISTATGFWMGVWGVLKALVWPAFLVYQAMKYFGL
jgi:hypothetical protein